MTVQSVDDVVSDSAKGVATAAGTARRLLPSHAGRSGQAGGHHGQAAAVRPARHIALGAAHWRLWSVGHETMVKRGRRAGTTRCSRWACWSCLNARWWASGCATCASCARSARPSRPCRCTAMASGTACRATPCCPATSSPSAVPLVVRAWRRSKHLSQYKRWLGKLGKWIACRAISCCPATPYPTPPAGRSEFLMILCTMSCTGTWAWGLL